MEIRWIRFRDAEEGGQIMSEIGVRGIDLFKIAGESISGWIPSWKTGEARPTRQPFCRKTGRTAPFVPRIASSSGMVWAR